MKQDIVNKESFLYILTLYLQKSVNVLVLTHYGYSSSSQKAHKNPQT